MEVLQHSNSNNSGKLVRGGTMRKMHEFHLNDNDKNFSKYPHHKDNSIDTTKYNFFTFLPKSLLFQFIRLANCYFLIIAIIQCIPDISPLSPTTAIAPISFVLCVSIIREGFEDFARRQYDQILNNEKVMVYKSEGFIETTSGSLRIGEIVLVAENDPVPADLILLDSSIEEGIAYIETGTLDGEKTLKPKIANKKTAGFFNIDNEGTVKQNFNVSGTFICDKPNSDLYKIEGNLELDLFSSGDENDLSFKIPIEAKQLLLKGAILKNTKWIIGFVTYTGKNTKLILNSKKPRMKFSRVESLMSRMLIAILFLQMTFCVICAILHSVFYNSKVQYNPYIPHPLRDSSTFDSFISYFTYMLLLNTMIPISLIISLEIVKLIQGYFTNVDVELYSHIRDRFAKAGSISLNEELGQVDFIFSDKTGTLTCNKMLFKYCVIGDVCYEYSKNYKNLQEFHNTNTHLNLNNHKFDNEESRMREENNIKLFGPSYMHEFVNNGNNNTKSQTPHISIGRTNYPDFKIVSETNPDYFLKLDEDYLLINEYWKLLSIAHECACNETDVGLDYTGMSPDDIELVKSAADQEYQFLKSPATDSRKIKIGKEIKEFKVLKVLEFSSDRKRMSIIIRDSEDNKIKLYMKGADSEIKKRLCKSSRDDFLEQANHYVELFSSKGFRTLLVGMKVIDEKSYEDWNNKITQAELDLVNKKESVEKCYAEIENNIYLLGATVVEDKLQDQVPETIRDLSLAGIKIWMLTGDKMNTAYNIGLSCNLISTTIKTFSISGEKGESIEKLIKEFQKFCQDFNNQNNGNEDIPSHLSPIPKQPFSIIIDAVALATVLKSEENTKLFLDIASQSLSVICCRVSPLQKSDVVNIMKNYNPKSVTLSIGDGGNDVSMIMEAHIGVGVYGEEGMRAVQASDFAIGEFKVLRRLLMFHGRTNNIRISEMILYFFFKNFVFTILHFYYGFYNNFSGQTIIDDWFISLYNMIFTAVPLGIRALSDFDITPDDGIIVDKMMPFLYKENRDNPIFTKTNFILSLFRGIVFGIINFFFIISSLDESSVDGQGNVADLWYTSANLFTGIIFIVSFRIIIVQRHFVFLMPIVILITSWAAYFAFVAYVHYTDTYKSFATMGVVFGSAKFYLTLLITVGFTAMIDKALHAYSILFSDKLYGMLMVERKLKGELNDISGMPETIINNYKVYAMYEGNNIAGLEYSQAKKSNEKDISKVDGVNGENGVNDVSDGAGKALSLRNLSQKKNQDLMGLMEAPYKKKISEGLELKWSEIEKKVKNINSNKNVNEFDSFQKEQTLSNSHNRLISVEKENVLNKLNNKSNSNSNINLNINNNHHDEPNGPFFKKLTSGKVHLVLKDEPDYNHNTNNLDSNDHL